MTQVSVLIAFVLFLVALPVRADDLAAALSREELQTVNDAVDKGLEWLSKQQNADGSFSNTVNGVGPRSSLVTSYAVLAFLSRGHQPGQGPYGRQMSRALDWLLSTQRADGSFSVRPPGQAPVGSLHTWSCLAVSEAYGVTTGEQAERIGNAIRKAIYFTRNEQASKKKLPIFTGGCSYDALQVRPFRKGLSDVGNTSRSLVFLRSAHSAGFEVPRAWIEEGLGFVSRCFAPGPHFENFRRLPVKSNQGVFRARPQLPDGKVKEDLGMPSSGQFPYSWTNFNTTAAGMLALQHNGRRDDSMVYEAADWLAEHSFPRQGTNYDFYYACYISSDAMSQLGGKHWQKFYPRVVSGLLRHQDPDGHWRLDTPLYKVTGQEYNTALAVLCLTLPDQLLPIHQR